MSHCRLIATLLACAWCGTAALAATDPRADRVPKVSTSGRSAASPELTAPSREAAEFFETHVRPVLAEKCYSCHGPKLQQSGLRLDSRAAILKGTGSGRPALTPGDPDGSPLIQALRYDGRIKMPPQGKLPQKEIDALNQWVKMGAPWPAPRKQSAGGSRQGLSGSDPQRPTPNTQRPHWAFQPVKNPPVPAVKNKGWVKTPIDAFIIQKLEAKGLAPSKPADRRTLIRRATFDLIGLPASAAEIEAFVADKSPDAWEKVVDRLLASPHYGERWGRYWLDIARYADTKGYVYTGERRYPFSYTYRDWVIRAFNEDLPYDQFLIQQIAADQLPLGEDKRPLAAMGFLTLGRRFVNMQPDIIDDRIDVVFRGTQGLTVACARCHDHKFDPIPTKDYYSLYGVFAGSTETTVRLVDQPERTDAFTAYEKELQERERKLNEALDGACAELSERLRNKIPEYLAGVPEAARLPGEEFYVIMGPNEVNPIIIRSWRAYIDRSRKAFDPVFAPWHAFEALPARDWSARAPDLARRFAENRDPRGTLNPLVAGLFTGPPPASMQEVAARYGQLLLNAHRQWRALAKTATDAKSEAPKALPDRNLEALRQVLYGVDSPATIPRIRISDTEYYFDEATRNSTLR